MEIEAPDEKLLDCPFCGGGTTEIRANGRIWQGMRYSDPVSISVVHWCEPRAGQPSRSIERVGRDLASAIAAWNKRAPDAPNSPNAPGTNAQKLPIERMDDILAQWKDAYLAFQGAFDTPVARRKDDSEFAQDARRRLREFDELMKTLIRR